MDLSKVPGCGQCTQGERRNEFSTDEKEVIKRQKAKDKIDKKIESSNPQLSRKKNDLLSNQDAVSMKSHETINTAKEEVKDKPQSNQKMDKATIKYLRKIYKNNHIIKIQRKFREYLLNKKKPKTETKNQKDEPKKGKIEEVIHKKQEREKMRGDKGNIETSKPEFKHTKPEIHFDEKLIEKIKSKQNSKRNSKENSKSKSKEKEKEKEGISNYTTKKHSNNQSLSYKKEFDLEEKKDPADTDKSKKMSSDKKNYFSHKKTSDYRQNKPTFEEKEKIIQGGKFDMISLKADSTYGDKTQGQFYFANKNTKEFKHTSTSIKTVDKSESGVKRPSLELNFSIPFEIGKNFFYILFKYL